MSTTLSNDHNEGRSTALVDTTDKPLTPRSSNQELDFPNSIGASLTRQTELETHFYYRILNIPGRS